MGERWGNVRGVLQFTFDPTVCQKGQNLHTGSGLPFPVGQSFACPSPTNLHGTQGLQDWAWWQLQLLPLVRHARPALPPFQNWLPEVFHGQHAQ